MIGAYPQGKLIPTAYLIDELELTASSFLESKLTGKHSSVGGSVLFKHLKWPIVHDRLKFEATVVKVDARKATFDVVISDERTGEIVATGANGRAVIAYD
jgi:predicted thioesterase